MPLRVLHVTSVETDNYFLNNLIAFTDPQEVAFAAATTGNEGGFTEGIRSRGASAFALGCPSRKDFLKSVGLLRGLIRSERPDVLHAHLFEPTVLCLISTGVYLPVVVTRHHSDALYRIANPLKRAGYLAVERWINHSAAHLIAPSQMVRDILLRREKVPAGKVTLIPYGQTRERFDAVSPDAVAGVRAELCMEGSAAIVCVSRMVVQKGHRFLFEAVKPLITAGLNATLYLVGTGPDEHLIREQARAEGIADRVRFLGWRNDALTVLAAADLVVHPSLEDALPSAVIEALALKKPLVVSNVSGAADLVGDDEHGFVVPMADSAAMRARIQQTLADMPAAVAKAARGSEFVFRYMDAHRVAESYFACYAGLRP